MRKLRRLGFRSRLRASHVRLYESCSEYDMDCQVVDLKCLADISAQSQELEKRLEEAEHPEEGRSVSVSV